MGLPSKLKHMNIFNDGESWLGEASEATLPKLARKMEGWRGAGMDGEIKFDMGQEPIEFEWTAGGIREQVFAQFGATTHDALQLRFAGSYQADDTGLIKPVEIVVRGRHEEVDPGKAKTGDDTEIKVKTVCSYYKLIINGREVIEIDIMNMIFKADGRDILAAHRAAIT